MAETKKHGYLDDEINKLAEDRFITEAKVKAAQYSFAEGIKKGLGQQIKKELNPTKWQLFKMKIKTFFKKLGNIYG